MKKTPGSVPLTISSYVDGRYCVPIQGRRICNDPGDESVSGPSVRLSLAMKYSLNTTFDQLAEQAGPDQVAATAHAAGIPKTDSEGNKTLVNANGETGFGIGIGDYPVRPIDQAVGFATFANNGERNDAYFVKKATDSNGDTVYEHDQDPARAVHPKVANDVTLTLEPIAGWSGDALAGGRISAAKTGTEGIPGTTQNSDAWMVGYTPQVSAAVWAGSGSSTQPIYNSAGAPEYGSDLPGKTWKLFMDSYLSGRPNLPMATKQLITGGVSTARVPTTAPPTTTSASPTVRRSTGFSTPSRSPSSSSPPPTPPSTPASPTCSPVLLGQSCGPTPTTTRPNGP
jgi:membrane peptidoglycan carboxypeptidase